MARLTLDGLLAACNATTRAKNPGLFPAGGLAPVPVAQPPVCNGPLAAPPCEARFTSRVLVRITSYRCGDGLDPDNVCVKWMVDCLRYSRVIRDDRRHDIALQVEQETVATRKEERTEITVEICSPCTAEPS